MKHKKSYQFTRRLLEGKRTYKSHVKALRHIVIMGIKGIMPDYICLMEELIGCSREQFMLHLEHHFDPKMTWDNRGGDEGWTLDHHVPCKKFNLSKEDEVLSCFHWSNYRPLWREANYMKKDMDLHEYLDKKEKTSNGS